MAHWHKEITDRLEKHSDYEAQIEAESISVACNNPESFMVSIQSYADDFQVSFDGWHEHFQNANAALNCFAFGLSDECRLKVTLRGNMECAWTVQSQEEGTWTDDSATGLILIPFWHTKRIKFRQNILPLKR